ncbi:putative oxidoreductase [Lachnellula suecica]|uniref:Putative oxidoreductase n=1 Tax=Lachnellula suecica TaxID=602035 RepID=A0A8T9CHU1_9HELO|nr:putative oxidoreductase [Lachnellula suecica]
MASYLVTGASRGLGFEMVRQLASLPTSEVSQVFATARGDAPALQELVQNSSGRVVIVKLDSTNEASVKQAATAVGAALSGKGLDVLINNAGVMPYSPEGVVTMDNLESTLSTNVVGVHRVTQAFFPLLKKSNLKKVANITSTYGSNALAPIYMITPSPAYKISKAALNHLTVQYALDYEKDGFTFFAISPGWLRTELGGDWADLSVEEGTKATLDKIIGAGKEQNGQFLNIHVKGWETVPEGKLNHYDGKNAPW